MRQPNMTDYEETRKNFKLEIPESFNFGFDVVDRWANEQDKLALVCADSSGTRIDRYQFSDIRDLSNRFANMLIGLGINKGDKVFVMVPRIVEIYAALVGMHKLGAMPMPAANILTPKDCEYRITTAGAVAAVIHRDNVDKINAIKDQCPTLKTLIVVGGEAEGWESCAQLMAQASPELERASIPATQASDPMLIYFTSGTTKFPKMVMHRHSYPMAHSVTARYWQDLSKDDLHWTLSDTGWAKFAWGKIYGQWYLGAALMMHDQQGAFNAKRHLDLLQECRVTSFCAPPTAYRMLILEDLSGVDFSNLRHCNAAGEPLNPEVIRAWKEASGVTIYDGYGQTETINLVANFPCVEVRPGSMGKPVPGMNVDIVDDDGNPVPVGEEGNIAVKTKPDYPAGLCDNYYGDEEATNVAWVGDWYFTADRGYKDEEGYFWFVGRADDVIKASGYRIGPFEVESALQAHPAVAESAVVGVPDELRGTVVKAFVVLAPGFVAGDELVQELQEFVKQETAPYKYPRHIQFVDDLPKTISGKIRRVELRNR